MGTRSKRSGFGVVAVTLGLAACGGKYDVGSGETEAQAGEGGAGSAGTGYGGSSTSTGGAGGDAGGITAGSSAVTGGVSSGGFAGTYIGGSSAGGTSGVGACLVPEAPFPTYERAAPEVVWERLCEFLHGEPHEPLLPLPETTTNDWVREAVRVLIDERTLEELGNPPGGLVTFMREWAFDGDGAESARLWADNFARPGASFGALFDEVDDRVSFLSDRAFLVAYPTPTRRGVWITANLACVAVDPPPFETEPVSVPPNMTRRQALESATRTEASCAGCHALLDPPGFSLEHYDELGEYRTTENGLPIDASGTAELNGTLVTFDDIGGLAPPIGRSCIAKQCFAGKLFQYALTRARPDDASTYEANELAYVQNRFTEHDGEFVYLLEAIALTPAFLRE
jgi:hypothetical protein